MNYLHLIFILLFSVSAIFLFWSYANCLKKDYLRRIIERSLLEKRNCLPSDLLYSSETALLTAEKLAFLPSQKLKQITPYLKNRNIDALIRFFEKNKFSEIAQRLKSACGKIKKHFPYKNKKAQHASLLLKEAKENLAEGDLLSASEKSSLAAKIFNKLNYIYEEAESYLLMGTIYRVSAVFDVADFMLRTSAKLFHYLGAINKEAEAIGTFGMLMTTQKRFEEALSYFEKAEKLYRECNQISGCAEIINQQALCLLLANNIALAQKKACQALKKHSQINNLQGQAFSLEIYAYIYRIKENWKIVFKKAHEAALLYQKINFPAYLEMCLLQAEALFAIKKYPEAEKLLRQIIEDDKKQRSCFQVANSYNLLGLIYLLQKDLKRARTLFSQSLNMEIRNDRTLGALIDYANMANIEAQSGNLSLAQKYLTLAIEQARELEEEELIKILEKKLNQNKATS